MKEKPKSPFAIALAARRGDIKPEALSGAAKRLFLDHTLSRDDLSAYAKPQEVHIAKAVVPRAKPLVKQG